MNDDFLDIDFSDDEKQVDPKSEVSKEVKKQTKTKSTKKKEKSEDKHEQKKEQEVKPITQKQIDSSNAVILDLQNTDDRKKLEDFFNEKRVLNIKGKEFIMSEQEEDNMLAYKSVMHTILVENILEIDIYKYFDNLIDIENPAQVTEKIYVHHKGYGSYEPIKRKTYEYLINTAHLPKKCDINIRYVDVFHHIAFVQQDDKVMDSDWYKKKYEYECGLYKKLAELNNPHHVFDENVAKKYREKEEQEAKTELKEAENRNIQPKEKNDEVDVDDIDF